MPYRRRAHRTIIKSRHRVIFLTGKPKTKTTIRTIVSIPALLGDTPPISYLHRAEYAIFELCPYYYCYYTSIYGITIFDLQYYSKADDCRLKSHKRYYIPPTRVLSGPSRGFAGLGPCSSCPRDGHRGSNRYRVVEGYIAALKVVARNDKGPSAISISYYTFQKSKSFF